MMLFLVQEGHILLFALLPILSRPVLVEPCSPPYSKTGNYTIKQVSLGHRLSKAELVIIGTVIQLTNNRDFGYSMATVAVHMKLRGKSVQKVINIHGFGPKSFKMVPKPEISDCTETNIDLYGTYLFTLKEVRVGSYYNIHEIDFQPAATEMKCQVNLQSKLRRALTKFRKLKRNKAQCFILHRYQISITRRCLRPHVLIDIVSKFQYNNINTRQYYCKLKQSEQTKRKKNADSKQILMRDVIQEKEIGNSVSNAKLLKNKKISENLNLIYISKNEKTLKYSPEINKTKDSFGKWRLDQEYLNTRTSHASLGIVNSSNFILPLMSMFILQIRHFL